MDSNNADDRRRCGRDGIQSPLGGVRVAGNSTMDISPRSGGQNKLVAECGRDWTATFEERLQVGFGGFLKAENCFAAIFAMCVAAGEQSGFRNPDAVFILTHLNPREWNEHRGQQ
jgi:hypothetical protein